MNITDLQRELVARGHSVTVDGNYGPETSQAVLALLQAGAHAPLSDQDVQNAATKLGATPAHVRTVRDVEAAGAGYLNGLPKILFEGHIFSRLTRGRFDRTNPSISYPNWDRSKYPASQQGRYNQLLQAIGLDVDAAFSAASYGAFQILGSNYKVCGFASPFEFVMAQCQSEGMQLNSFINFVIGNHLDAALRNGQWAVFARGYNGTAYRSNGYDTKLAQAFAVESRHDATVAAAAPPFTGAGKLTATVNLRDAPGGNILGTLAAGGFVNVIATTGDWSQVQLPTMTGYVAKQFVEKA